MVLVVPTLPRSFSDALTSLRESRARETAKTLLHAAICFWQPILFIHRLLTYRRSPSVGNTRCETTKHRYGSPLKASPQWATIKVAKMPAQDTELNRRQGLPFLDFRRTVFME
jgi:hypothetical protein